MDTVASDCDAIEYANSYALYRPVRDRNGRIISVPSLALNNPQVAAQIIAPPLADQPVEMFGVR